MPRTRSDAHPTCSLTRPLPSYAFRLFCALNEHNTRGIVVFIDRRGPEVYLGGNGVRPHSLLALQVPEATAGEPVARTTQHGASLAWDREREGRGKQEG